MDRILRERLPRELTHIASMLISLYQNIAELCMKEILTTHSGGLDVLKIVEKPRPSPQPGEVLISVRASGLNFADILARQGLYPDAPRKPCVLGYEVSGIVEEVGKETDSSVVGKEIIALTRFGGQSELVVTPLDFVVEKPKSLSFEQAAALPVNYLTAYGLIVAMGSLKKEESILIHNAGSGVGLAAIDISRHLGAKTYGTASESKHSFLKERGLEFAIDYRKQDWLAALMQLTNGNGVELILDPIGGENWKKDYEALRATGRMGVYGLSAVSGNRTMGILKFIGYSIRSPRFQPWTLFNANKGVFGFNLAHLMHEKQKVKNWMREILSGLEHGWIRPYVSKIFTFNEVAQAHSYIESRSNIGKVILVP
jgi:NADPH:quinone reductase-like Zn-dependent oxidoreductase